MTNLLLNTTETLHKENWHDHTIFNNIKITWLGGTTQVPKDVPECGFDGKCKETSSIFLTVCLAIPGIIIIIIVIYKFLQMQKYENDVNSKISILKFIDVKTNTMLGPNTPLEEIIDIKGSYNGATGSKKLQGLYDNRPVMIKKLFKKEVVMTREVMLELKQLRDLKHPNINGIIGVTCKTPNITIIQDYSKKGSLYDVLNNEDIQLDWVFKYTFLWELLNGMCAIHDSPIKYHGNLTSRNCLITHRWVLQVSDFGLREFKKMRGNKKAQVDDEQVRYEALLWTAPENINFPKKENRTGDVYSFAIIISEVINRQPPFSAFDDMRPSDIIHYVRKRCIPPFRPHVTLQTGLDARLLDIMKNCWNEWPEDRPMFRELKPLMKQIRGEGIEILDNMIEMMENYSRDLDRTVRERTDMYRKEKIKSNELLYRCVPKPVVTKLLEGDTIEPDKISNTTILIIRLANLKQLSEKLSASQLVDVINDYNRVISNVTDSEQFSNVYKLLVDREEVVLCSSIPGYPERAKATTMAEAALSIARGRLKFKWRHVTLPVLKMKMTLHSGISFN